MSSECFQNSSASWLKYLSQDTCSVKIEMLVAISYVMFFKCYNKLNLLLFPLKQFSGSISLSFKDISSLLRSAISKSF